MIVFELGLASNQNGDIFNVVYPVDFDRFDNFFKGVYSAVNRKKYRAGIKIKRGKHNAQEH